MLSASTLLDILCLRQKVFVIEQQCLYEEADAYDALSTHLLAIDTSLPTPGIVAYARLLPPNTKYPEPSFGRFLVASSHRGTGLGRELLQRCIALCQSTYPNTDILISAQLTVQRFYASQGFVATGPSYDDAGIEHIDMTLPSR